MLNQIVRWLRTEAGREQGWSRWIGRTWARVSYAHKVEPTWLELNRCNVGIKDLPVAFQGFRIAQMSDFHCSRHVTPAYLNEAIDLALGQHPDLIVLTGDFIHRGFQFIQPMAATLGRLSAPFGVYAVLGNHDFSVRNALGFRRYRHLHRAVAQALTQQSIRVLQNEAVVLAREDARLHLIGVDDLWSRVCDLEQAYVDLDPAVPHIVLAHNPWTVARLQGRRCDLMLSGHTHGGQVHHPIFGRPTLSHRARRFAAGMYRHQETHLYVNKGVGFGFKFRFGVRPEVATFTLQPGE